VTAPTAALVDALTTAEIVMGKSGIELIEQLTGCEVFAIQRI
jgi:thiamine biosynthesis lipoprotein ApbE